jgi:hypothetical protein
MGRFFGLLIIGLLALLIPLALWFSRGVLSSLLWLSVKKGWVSEQTSARISDSVITSGVISLVSAVIVLASMILFFKWAM